MNPVNPYYNSESVTSSMIWGSQWDAMMNWMLKDENTKEFVTEITGNHEDKVATTGSYTNDFAKNIFDLSSNVAEWTQETGNHIYRMYRGGYCVTTNDKYGIYSASSRYTTWQVPTMGKIYTNPTNSGGDNQKNYLGSRMALYIKNTEDTTPPKVEITERTAGTNNIEVKVNAVDNESGISKYKYSISLKDFKASDFEETDVLSTVETYGSSNVFQGLTQNQSYYIRVEVTNGAGQTAIICSERIKTKVLNVQEGAIIRESIWGKDGDGRAYFTISEEEGYENEGYYIQYQVDKGGQTGYQENGQWTIGETVKGLNVGDVIYTRIYDGVNEAEYYMTTNITELETFSEVYQETTKYEDYDTEPVEGGETEEVLVGTAYIPAGFRVATSSMTKEIQNGLVIEDEEGNQYVWIPVKDVVYDGSTTISSTYKPMVQYQTGYNENTEQYFEGILYNYSGTTSSRNTGYGLGTTNYREPSLVTGSTANLSWVFMSGNNYDATNYTQLRELGINSATEMGVYLNNRYTEMVESIQKYGGYYVGRYETSLFTESGTNSTSGTVVKSIIGQQPMASVNWYKMYLSQDSSYANNPYYGSESVTSSMISGSQWDRMLNFILEGSDKEKVTAIIGNHTGTREETGEFGDDIMNNIFDLGSNVREWTTEAYGSTNRARRGGYCSTADVGPSGDRSSGTPTSTNVIIGSRLSLYVK